MYRGHAGGRGEAGDGKKKRRENKRGWRELGERTGKSAVLAGAGAVPSAIVFSLKRRTVAPRDWLSCPI